MPDRDPLTGVPPSRHPFQFFALAACMVAGAAAAFNFSDPRQLYVVLPDYMVQLWGWTLMIGGLLGLTCSFWRDRITGLLLERISLGGIGGVTFVYGAVLIGTSGNKAITTIAFLLSISLASAWRIVHVNRELKVLSRWIERNY